MTDPKAAAEHLYGLSLEEFTAARNALARETSKGGDKQAAEEIRSLRKPSAAAWALNQLARAHPEDVRELVSAGERLRSAQAELLAGGGREGFTEASNAEQRLVAELSRTAGEIARDSGAAATDALERRAGDTLRAAALDPAVAESLVEGRLVGDHAVSGLGGALPSDAAPPRERRRSKSAAASRQLEQAEERLRAAETTETAARKRHESATRQTARLRARAEEALERLRAAEADQRAVERELTEAGEDRSRLMRKVEELRRGA